MGYFEVDLRNDHLLSKTEVIRRLGIKMSSLDKHMKDGEFPQPACYVFSRPRWTILQLNEWLNQGPMAGIQTALIQINAIVQHRLYGQPSVDFAFEHAQLDDQSVSSVAFPEPVEGIIVHCHRPVPLLFQNTTQLGLVGEDVDGISAPTRHRWGRNWFMIEHHTPFQQLIASTPLNLSRPN